MVLHALEQHFNGLPAEVVGAVLAGQGVGLVDEQHAPQGFLDDLSGFDGGLSHEARHQPRTVHLHKLALGQHADGMVDFRQQPGDGGFAGAWIAQKYQVQGHRRHWKTLLLPELLDLDQID